MKQPKTVYKVVCTKNNEPNVFYSLIAAFNMPTLDFILKYEMGKITTPKRGMIFCFEKIEHAEWCAAAELECVSRNCSLCILKGTGFFEGKDVIFPRYGAEISDCKMEEFWKRGKDDLGLMPYQNSTSEDKCIPLSIGTIFVDSFIPTEIIVKY